MKKLSRKIFSYLQPSLVFGFFLSAFVLWPFLPIARAAACSLTSYPTAISIMAGDTDGVYAGGSASNVVTTGGQGVVRDSTLSASSGNSAIVAVLAPTSVSSNGNGVTNTFKLSARSLGSATVEITYDFSITKWGSTESCSKSINVGVTVTPFTPTDQPLQTNDSNTVRILRGSVGLSGGKIGGSGFTSRPINKGYYHVTFNSPFKAVVSGDSPIVHASIADGTTVGYIAVRASTLYSFDVYTSKQVLDGSNCPSGSESGAAYAEDMPFSFIVVGHQSKTANAVEQTEGGQLMVVRGSINGPLVAGGKGFIVTRNSGGSYHVTFLRPFSGIPVVVVGDNSVNFYTEAVSSVSSSGFNVGAFHRDCQRADSPFSFVAVGPASSAQTSAPVFSEESSPLKIVYGRLASSGYITPAGYAGYGISGGYESGGVHDINYSSLNPFTTPSVAALLGSEQAQHWVSAGNAETTKARGYNASPSGYGTNIPTSFVGIGPVAAPLPPSCAGAGTIKVNSLNASTSQPVQSSWIFSAAPSTNPCLVNTCTSSTAQTYLNMPAGSPPSCLYTLTPIPYSAGPLFSLKGVEKQFAAGEWENNIFALGFWKNLIAKVAEAVVVGPCTGPYCTLNLDAGGTVVFNITWSPLAAIGVSPNPLSLQGGNPSGVINISNNGANGSTLANLYYMGNPVYTGPPGWLVTSTLPTSIKYGDPAQPVTISANTSGLPLGSCQTAGSCVATITLQGTSLPSGAYTAPVNVRINLILSAPQTSCNSFTASPTTIIPPQPTTLSWDCAGLSGCGITSDVGPDIGPVAAVGSTNISPASSTVYTLACTNTTGGGVITPLPLQVDITVNAPGTIEIPP
jgi:hypothetical protein